jgi:small subunit ribosomal protein S16
MLVIRLARGGRKKYPVYRIVAADSRRAATGKFVAVLGNYNPHTKELKFQKEELAQFIANGAQPSEAVLRLMRKDGIELPKWAVLVDKHRKPKKEPEAVEEKSEASVEGDVEAADAPAEEATAEVASEAAEAKTEAAEETHNIDSAEATEATDSTEATEAVADAAVETAQAENDKTEEPKTEDTPVE